MSNNLRYTPSNITIETMQGNSQQQTMVATEYNDNITLQPAAVLSETAMRFSGTLNVGQALVKHISSNETKRIELKPNMINGKSIKAQAYNLRDPKVAPKQNNTRIDETIVNIFSHKGPDEPSIGGFEGGL